MLVGGELDLSGGGELEVGVHGRRAKTLRRGRGVDGALGIAMGVLMCQALWTACRFEYIELRLNRTKIYVPCLGVGFK
jgi:hypothetical protein